VGATAGFAFSVLQIFPTGDLQGKYMAHNQPATTAAMEGLFKSEMGAPIVLLTAARCGW
jgi:cytochrome d ubiquinol oxidase subunit I